MEVHAHTHTARKKWTHYLWEFLMLFLAVFCGFLAEYQLEHTIEHNREKEYMRSMVDDLQTDTAALNRIIPRIERTIKTLDSSILLYTRLKNPTPSQVVAWGMYTHSMGGFNVLMMVFTNRTSVQLKFSGSMRLVRKKKVADSLITYWNVIDQVEKQYERMEAYRMEARKISFEIFNFFASETVHDRMDSTVAIDTSTLLNDSPALLGKYINTANALCLIYRNAYLPRMQAQFDRAVRLMALIRKEYHLD